MDSLGCVWLQSCTGMSWVGPVPGPGSCVWYIHGTVTNSFPRTEYSAQIRNEVRPRNRADDAEPSPPRLTRPTNLFPRGRRSSLISPSGRRLSSLVSPSGRRLWAVNPRIPAARIPAGGGGATPQIWPRVGASKRRSRRSSGHDRGLAPSSSLRASSPFPTAGASLLAGGWPWATATLLVGAQRRCGLPVRIGRSNSQFFLQSDAYSITTSQLALILNLVIRVR